MNDVNGVLTPMIKTCKLRRHVSQSFSDPRLYMSIVGSLQYITLTKPNIAFCVNKTCQFISYLLDLHWYAVNRILRYLSGTIYHGLVFSSSTTTKKFSQKVYNDSNWTSDPYDRRLTSGSCIFFGPNLWLGVIRSNNCLQCQAQRLSSILSLTQYFSVMNACSHSGVQSKCASLFSNL